MERYLTLFAFLTEELLLAILAKVNPKAKTVTIPTYKADDIKSAIVEELEFYIENNGEYNIEDLDAAIVEVLGIHFDYCHYQGETTDENGWRHNAYNVRLMFGCIDRGIRAPYKMGMAHTSKPEPLEVLDSLLCDAECYEMTGNIDYFFNEFGYKSVTRAQSAFNACADTHHTFKHLF